MIYKTKIEELEQSNRLQKQLFRQQEQKISSLQQSRKIQDQRIQQLEAQIFEKTQDIERLDTRVTSLDGELETHKDLLRHGTQRPGPVAKEDKTDFSGPRRLSNASEDAYFSELTATPERHITRNREFAQRKLKSIKSKLCKTVAAVRCISLIKQV